MSNRESVQLRSMQKGASIDASDLLKDVGEVFLRPNDFPVSGEEDQIDRRDELLECPPTLEPSALTEGRFFFAGVFTWRSIREIRVAHRRKAIPSIHRIDRLRQLGAASLVDTASIDPQPFEAFAGCESATVSYLLTDMIPGIVWVLYGRIRYVLESLFLPFLPHVREDGI